MSAGLRVQPNLWTVLTPKWRGVLARLRREHARSRAKFVLLALTGAGFWTAVFGVSYRVLRYIRDVQDIGFLLAGKVLGVILLAFLSILLLSNLITALSTFFLAKDLDLLVAAPISWVRLYLAKLGETVVHSSWMVALLALPILTAYGIAFSGGPLFPFVALAAMVPYLLLPAVAGTILTVLLVNVFPARRTRELLGLVGIGAAGVVVMLLRFIRPEQLARPEGFRNFLDYLTVLKTPTSPWLPSEWAAEMIMNWLTRVADPWPIGKLWAAAAVGLALGAWVHRALFYQGYSKAQEGAERKVRRPLRGPAARVLNWLPPQKREFLFKDLRLFFRDNTQWSQLILLAVLLMIYIFNIKSLPIHTGERIPVRAGHHHLLPQPRPGRLRAGRRGGAVHLSGHLARGTPDVAAPIEPARSARDALEQVLDGHRAAAAPGGRHHAADEHAARGERVHDGGEPRDDRALHAWP